MWVSGALFSAAFFRRARGFEPRRAGPSRPAQNDEEGSWRWSVSLGIGVQLLLLALFLLGGMALIVLSL